MVKKGLTMFYSVKCLQNGNIMYSGRNSKTQQICIKKIIDYVNSDSPENDKMQPTLENVIVCEFEIFEHQEKIEEN